MLHVERERRAPGFLGRGRIYPPLTAARDDPGGNARMDFGNIPLFRAMAQRMAWLGERQQVLAQNVANVDTPGFTPKDLKAPDFRALVAGATGRLPLAATEPGHIASGSSSPAAFRAVAQKGGERTPSGNSVSIEDEMMKVSQTATDYALTTNLYKRHLAMLKAALGRATG
jgi:flagellar basal-body rod protein FlgB